MESIFKVNRATVFWILVILLGGLLAFIWLFDDVLLAVIRGIDVDNEIWQLFFLFLGFQSLLYGIVIAILVTETSVVITEDLVMKRRLFSKTKILWDEITFCETIGFRILLKTERDEVWVNLIFYKAPGAILEYVERKTKKLRT